MIGKRFHKPLHYRKLFSAVTVYVLVLITMAAFLFPFLWMVSVAFKPADRGLYLPAPDLSGSAHPRQFRQSPQPGVPALRLEQRRGATLTTVVTVFFAVFAAYSFSRLQFRGRKTLLVVIILTQLLPLAVLIVPMYRIMSQLSLINTYPALIIAYLTFTIPAAVWFLRGFFASIPYELEEAAMIDGCTQLRAFLSVILPLSLPGISATATYVFFVTWQELMFADRL